MKILHLIGGGDVRGGSKTHLLGLLGGPDAPFEVTLVNFREGGFAADARTLGVDTAVVSGNPFKGLPALRRLYREGGYDIVHSHGARGNMMALLLKWLDGATVVTTIHSDPKLDYLGRPVAALTFGLINQFAMRRIKHHVAVSDPVADMLIERGFSPYGIFPIYNGIDFTVPNREFDRAAWLGERGLTLCDGDVVCGIAARLNPVKDIPTLLRAFAKTPVCAKLIIAGSDDGDTAESLGALAGDLGVADRVCFAGWVDDMDAFFRAIDINVLTSLYETFPYALTDGTRMKLATIATRVGGVPELIDHGVNGFMFTPGDHDALAGYLNRLIGDQPLRLALGEALHIKAKSRFSMEAMVNRQIDIYNAVLRREGFSDRARMCVTVCGAYGKKNSGDDAILEAIVDEIRQIDPDLRIYALSRTPASTRAAHRVDSFYTFNLFALRRVLKSSRLYINGGGSLMQDTTSTRSLLFYLYTLRCGRKLGCRVMMYGCGIGPVLRTANRKRVTDTLNANVDAITLREDDSFAELYRLGVTSPEIILAADPALTLAAADSAAVDTALTSSGADLSASYICFALRRWKDFSSHARDIAAAADAAYERYGCIPLFLPIEQGDSEAALEVIAHLTAPHVELSTASDAHMIIGVMSRMKAVVAMRLHALIFASGTGVPLVGIAYDPKVSGFMRYMKLQNFLDLGEVSAQSLTTCITDAIDGYGAEQSARAVERLREVEHRNVEVARRLLNIND